MRALSAKRPDKLGGIDDMVESLWNATYRNGHLAGSIEGRRPEEFRRHIRIDLTGQSVEPRQIGGDPTPAALAVKNIVI